MVWDQHEETAVRVPDGAEQFITWGPPRQGANRLRLGLALLADGDQADEVERLVSLGAKRIDTGHGVRQVVLADPDDNEFSVLTTS